MLIRISAPRACCCLTQVWLQDCKSAFSALTSDKVQRQAAEDRAADAKSISQPDDLIDFVHLKARRGLSQLEIEDEVSSDLARATGGGQGRGGCRGWAGDAMKFVSMTVDDTIAAGIPEVWGEEVAHHMTIIWWSCYALYYPMVVI